MAAGYSIPESDALGMLGDAHSTNYAENRDFFLNQNNPTNFERTWNTAYFLYKRIGAVDRADAVRPGDGLLDHPEARPTSRSTPARRTSTTCSSRPRPPARSRARTNEILTKTVVIHFFPNSWDLNKKITRTVDGKDVEELYDPNVQFVVEEVGKLAGQYGAARIVIEGHTDASMKGQVPKSLVQELSLNRANAVKEAHPAQVPDAPAEPVRDGRHGLGSPGRPDRSRQPREEPPRRDQGLPGGGGAAAK